MIHVNKNNTQVEGYTEEIMREIMIANIAVIKALESNNSKKEVIENFTWYIHNLKQLIVTYLSDENANIEDVLSQIIKR